MKHFTHEQMFRGKPITAEITVTDCGVQVGLYGGDPISEQSELQILLGRLQLHSLKDTKRAVFVSTGVKNCLRL